MSKRSTYTREIADLICERVKQGRALSAVCRDPDIPAENTVRGWIRKNYDGFGVRYGSVAHPAGHPTSYTDELAERICLELRRGRTLVDVCRDSGMPTDHTVQDWVQGNRGGFAERYRLARELGYLAMADEIIEIVDDSRNDWIERLEANGETKIVFNRENVTRSRLRFEGRRWLLSKALPRIFGDRLELRAVSEPVDTLAELMKEIDGRTRGLPNRDKSRDEPS